MNLTVLPVSVARVVSLIWYSNSSFNAVSQTSLIGLILMSLGGIFALIGGIKYYIDLSKYIEN